MVGYTLDRLKKVAKILDDIRFSYIPNKQMLRASYYSIVSGSSVDRSLDREIVTFLLVLYIASKKDTVKHHNDSFLGIIEKDVVHGLNRGYYNQRSKKSMLMLDGVVKAFISKSLDSIGKDEYMEVLTNYSIYHNQDLDDMLIDDDSLKEMLLNKSLFRKRFVSYEDLKNEV